MDFSKLSYGQILSMADQLKSASGEMQGLLDEIKALLNEIGNDETWSGTAASATKEQFDTLSQKFPEFSQAVEECCTYLNKVVENYKSVDTMVTGQ